MNILKTTIEGCYILEPDISEDYRGKFVKTFQFSAFADANLETSFTEEYYSTSRKGVLRGLHFQSPPADHVKVTYCLEGSVFDAVVDLRPNSPSYQKHLTTVLTEDNANMLYIPRGLAHGFLVTSEIAIVAYKVSSEYDPRHDTGILWNSAGIPWPDMEPALSERDKQFTTLEKYKTPF